MTATPILEKWQPIVTVSTNNAVQQRRHYISRACRLLRPYGRSSSVFVSFFPKPKLFFASALLRSVVGIAVWYTFGKQAGDTVGLPSFRMGSSLGLSFFWSGAFLWFDLYFVACIGIFAIAWMTCAPHP